MIDRYSQISWLIGQDLAENMISNNNETLVETVFEVHTPSPFITDAFRPGTIYQERLLMLQQ